MAAKAARLLSFLIPFTRVNSLGWHSCAQCEHPAYLEDGERVGVTVVSIYLIQVSIYICADTRGSCGLFLGFVIGGPTVIDPTSLGSETWPTRST
jgi:hypothetical protein